jgi:hypothetical protein
VLRGDATIFEADGVLKEEGAPWFMVDLKAKNASKLPVSDLELFPFRAQLEGIIVRTH